MPSLFLFLRVLVVFRLREGIQRGGKQGGVVAEQRAEGVLLQLRRRGSRLPLHFLRDHFLHGGILSCKFFAHHLREHFALLLLVRGSKLGGAAGALFFGAVRIFVLSGRFKFAYRLFRALLHIRHQLCVARADLVDIDHGSPPVFFCMIAQFSFGRKGERTKNISKNMFVFFLRGV